MHIILKQMLNYRSCYLNNNFGSCLQIYSDYQMQQMSDNIHDPYGFTEDDFADNDDSR